MAERLRALIEKGPDAKGAVADGGLLAEGKPEPVYRDGELAGIALRNVPPDSFYAGLGLREGDVVSSINGASTHRMPRVRCSTRSCRTSSSRSRSSAATARFNSSRCRSIA
jgi:hypothetical protein